MREISMASGSNIISQEELTGIRTILDEGTAENTRKTCQGDMEYFMAWAKLTTGSA